MRLCTNLSRPLILLLAALWSLPSLAGVLRIPGPPMLADGVTTTTVLLYVDTPDPKVKIKADAGKVGGVELGAGGIVAFAFTPPAVSAPQAVNVRVNVNGVETVVALPAAPPAAGSLDITADPPVVAAGASAMIRIRPSGTSPVRAEGRRFAIAVSAGTVDSPVPAGDGTWIARYTPPKGMTEPMIVGIGAIDLAFPDRIIGVSTLPVTLKKSVSFNVQPNSSNVLTVSDRSYGPSSASPAGTVAFDVELDPRITTARLQSVNPDTSRLDETRPLPVLAPPQLLILPGSAAAPGQSSLPVRILVVDPAKTTAEAAPQLTASKGTFLPLQQQTLRPVNGERLYLTTLQLPEIPGELVLSATISGGSLTAKSERKLRALAGLPTVSLTANPPDLDPKLTSFTLTALVKDGRGVALPGKAPLLSAEGATLSGSVKDNKDGSYTSIWKRSSGSEVRVYGVPAIEASAGAPARLLVWGAAPAVRTGGTLTVTVAAVDAWGIGVPQVKLSLGVPVGDGSLPPEITTDARGLARVTYKAGNGIGLVGLSVEGGGIRTELALFQSPEGNGQFPPIGDAEEMRLIAAWKAACPALILVPPVPVAAPVLSTPASPVVATAPVTTAPVATPVPVATAPVPSADPVTPGATPGATAAPPGAKADRPKPSPGSGEIAPFRAAATLTNLRGTFLQDSNGQDGLLGSAESSAPAIGFFGLAADTRYWFTGGDWGKLGAEARFSGSLELVKVTDETRPNLPLEASGGLRYAWVKGPFTVEGGLGILYSSFTLLRYSDETLSDVALVRLSRLGMRLSAGVAAEKGPFRAAFELSEGFVLFPGITQLELDLDYTFKAPLTLHLSGLYDLRRTSFTAGSEGAGYVKQNRLGLGLGVGAVF